MSGGQASSARRRRLSRRTFLTGLAGSATAVGLSPLLRAGTGDGVLVEAGSFKERGGWLLDQQFFETVGSAYLLAHGMGKPVADACTTVEFPQPGKYRLWVRTKNWVPGKWAPPGRFRIIVNGRKLKTVFGTLEGWGWQRGEVVTIGSAPVRLALRDLTGFDARCDALFFARDLHFVPPADPRPLGEWRAALRQDPAVPPSAGDFDVVVAGGGIAGCAAAIAGARQGARVALIHDRALLGGNASGEVRVHTEGIYGKGEEILKGLDTRPWPNGSASALKDDIKRRRAMAKERGITQFLLWRVTSVKKIAERIDSVDAAHVESGAKKRFFAPLFVDCTGDGWLGFRAGADWRMGREGREEFKEGWPKHGELWSPAKPDKLTMGTSLLWYSKSAVRPRTFPKVPWAMDVAGDMAALAGEWYWEYAGRDTIYEAEEIRDHLLRAIYGSFYNAKRKRENSKVALAWVAHTAGLRESRRLMGDYIYSMRDMTEGRTFKDTVAEETRAIDVHYQRKLKGSPYDFLAEALYWRTEKYYIPYRTLYSRNVRNLLMAGRCFSCSHIGLGGPRVMRTTGQMGIAAGCAAALCVKHATDPREIYRKHLPELLKLVGRAGRRKRNE